jgi:hypothetical protein
MKALTNMTPVLRPNLTPRFSGISVISCVPINTDSSSGYDVRLLVDKSGVEKFKAFAAGRTQFERQPDQIEVPVSACYVYDGGSQNSYRVVVGEQAVFKGSPLEKLFRHLVKAMPVDALIKTNILNLFEKTEPIQPKPVNIQPQTLPVPIKSSLPVDSSPAFQPNSVLQTQPTAATLIKHAHEKAVAAGVPTGGGNGLERTFFLQDPQHPQAPPVKVSVSVKLGPVTVVTR